jgi:transposase-like protein
MNNPVRTRLKWIRLYEELGNSGVVCLRCGVSRPTLRKWWIRFQEKGIDGLQNESLRPKSSPMKKLFLAGEQLIYELKKRKLGHRRIQKYWAERLSG